MSEFPINFTVRGDPAVLFNPDGGISFRGYVDFLMDKYNSTETDLYSREAFDRSEVRETLYHYIFPRFYMYDRRGPWDKHFSASWHH